jgi:hypothetical protein
MGGDKVTIVMESPTTKQLVKGFRSSAMRTNSTRVRGITGTDAGNLGQVRVDILFQERINGRHINKFWGHRRKISGRNGKRNWVGTMTSCIMSRGPTTKRLHTTKGSVAIWYNNGWQLVKVKRAAGHSAPKALIGKDTVRGIVHV